MITLPATPELIRLIRSSWPIHATTRYDKGPESIESEEVRDSWWLAASSSQVLHFGLGYSSTKPLLRTWQGLTDDAIVEDDFGQ